MSHLRSFALFWWNFVVGDDWRLAAGIAVTLGVTWFATDWGADVWWLLPVAVAVLLAASLRRATQDPAPPPRPPEHE